MSKLQCSLFRKKQVNHFFQRRTRDHTLKPLDFITLSVKQDNHRICPYVMFLSQILASLLIQIRVDDIKLPPVVSLNPIHDGSHRPAVRSRFDIEVYETGAVSGQAGAIDEAQVDDEGQSNNCKEKDTTSDSSFHTNPSVSVRRAGPALVE